MYDDRLVTVELVALGDRDLAGENDHEARSDLAGGPKQFTGSKGAQVTEPTHPLDLQRIERRINLVVPLFANGQQLQCHLSSPGIDCDHPDRAYDRKTSKRWPRLQRRPSCAMGGLWKDGLWEAMSLHGTWPNRAHGVACLQLVWKLTSRTPEHPPLSRSKPALGRPETPDQIKAPVRPETRCPAPRPNLAGIARDVPPIVPQVRLGHAAAVTGPVASSPYPSQFGRVKPRWNKLA